ncbi:MAG: hypothetical protein K9H64_13480 [Bacteroidales bacterium]|nr:hypothetical protein [Bacteroidales bacterium]MCF8456364.1 hypothetical protein [Bacteroidales bacterium]
MIKGITLSVLLYLIIISTNCFAEKGIYIHKDKIILRGLPSKITIEIENDSLWAEFAKAPFVSVNGEQQSVTLSGNKAIFDYTPSEKEILDISVLDQVFEVDVKPIPLWISILPPLIAIVLALLFREVFTALILGILFGAATIFYFQGSSVFLALFQGLFALVDTYILQALNSSSHLSIILFSMLIGAMVSLISANGGMNGIVRRLSKYANSPRSGQFITWLLGVAIFFDDYANTLVVGNTMRPVTDRLKISREKLSYIVDSTAAPVAAIAFVTTWIGAELSYIEDGLRNVGLDESPYQVFLNSLTYSFYPVLALLFIVILIWQNRDFGPMYKAEVKARQSAPDIASVQKNGGSQNEDQSNIPARAFNAVIPVATIIFVTIGGLVYTGLETVSWNVDLSLSKNLSGIIGAADSYRALLWSSISGVSVAIILTLVQRLLSLQESIESLISGFKTMMTAVLILILAWALAKLTEDLHTADFITQILVAVELNPFFIPALTFIISGLVAFSTGSSWSTMAILYPLILPASWLLCEQNGLGYDESMAIFHNVVSTVLAGSVLGDHCSPISDTTILSSLASSCKHIDHVKTQLPYALVVGGTALVFGTVLSTFNIPTWILFLLCLVILYLIVRFVGKKVPDMIQD